MLSNSNTTAQTAQAAIREYSGVCHSQQPNDRGISYNADLLEEAVQGRLRGQESVMTEFVTFEVFRCQGPHGLLSKSWSAQIISRCNLRAAARDGSETVEAHD